MNNNFKIYKVNNSEYIVTSEEGRINKIKGNHAENLVEILKTFQIFRDFELVKEKLIKSIDNEFIDTGFNWLISNNFISPIVSIETKKIIFFGEFNNDFSYLNEIESSLNSNIKIKNIIDLSNTYFSIDNDVDLVVLFGPLWYDKNIILQIAEFMKNLKVDFLYIEPLQNGIIIGPLMNVGLNTLCINCLYKRKLVNSYSPNIIVENMVESLINHNNINILEIGNFKIHKSFIINEIEKNLIYVYKGLYNKSILIDYLNYNNQFFQTLKTIDCEVCSNYNDYNPL